MPNAPRPDNKGRMIRVEDALWEAAQERAAEKGETVSEAVRKFLVRYSRPKPEVCGQCGRPNPGAWCDSCGWQK